MLIVSLGMENQRRGLFFGRKVRFRRAFTDGLRRYHGYFFSFAVLYTFWFHPMIATWGHLIGFIHVVLVMTQGSLMFLRAHLNTRWMFLLEILVLPHAFQVALNQGNDIWPMFFFGFAAIFLITQIHGLGLKRWARQAFYGSFQLLVLYVYLALREPYQANEIIRIPLIEYVVLFIMYGITCRAHGSAAGFVRCPRAARPNLAIWGRVGPAPVRSRARRLRRPACHQTRQSEFGIARLVPSGRLQRYCEPGTGSKPAGSHYSGISTLSCAVQRPCC